MRRLFCLLCSIALAACGGAAPLLHPAHPMRADELTMGAGFSGRVPVAPSKVETSGPEDVAFEKGALAPGLAPWVGGRYGFDGNWDAGLTYTGRSIRLDGRHAFVVGEQNPALSIGLGASGLLPNRHENLGVTGVGDSEPVNSARVGGFGGDLPILIGYKSDADLYAAWLGARAGAELLRGQFEQVDTLDPNLRLGQDISGWHAFTGALVGFRVGFRYIYAAMELSANMHWTQGSVGDTDVSLRQFSLSPAGAVIGRF